MLASDEASQLAACRRRRFAGRAQTPSRSAARQSGSLTSGLVTAADLLAKQSRPRISPNVFKHGMAVEHPEYGAGTIIALSGDGPKRTAVVRFFSDQSERTFRLAFSDLAPAASLDS